MSEDYTDFDLDDDVSEVADIISFSNPPAGKHIYGIVFAGLDKVVRDSTDFKGVRMIYQLIKTVQKTKKEDMDAAVGSIFGEQFLGEKGKEWLKKRLVDIYGELEPGGFGKYLTQLNQKKMSEYMVEMTTTINNSKGPEGQVYENVKIQDIKMVAAIPLPEGFEMYEHEPQLD